MKWKKGEAKKKLTELLLEDAPTLTVDVEVAYQSQLGITCAYIRDPGECVSTQGWVHGYSTTEQRPLYLMGAPLLHALTVVKDYIAES